VFRFVFSAVALVATSVATQAQDISFVLQDWKAEQLDVSTALRSFSDSNNGTVNVIGADNNFVDFQQKTRAALESGANLAFWIGLSEVDIRSGLTPATDALGVETTFDISDWSMTLPENAVTSDGMIALGAGFLSSEPREKTIISVPYGTRMKLPIISAVPFQSSSASAESIEEWTAWLYGSQEGQSVQQALSLIPLTRDGSDDPSRWIQVIPRPTYQQSDDDGCGCDEQSTCDPDGYGFGAMSDLNRESSFAILPGITQDGLLQSDDDGGCSCESRAMSFDEFKNTPQFFVEQLGAEQAGRQNDWKNALENLRIASLDRSQIVTIMTCDPD
jgi:hypothetical protein